MEDEPSWWDKFNACEASSQALLRDTCSDGMPERMDALDSIFDRLRQELLEECQAEIRTWNKKNVGSFHPRFRRVAAYAEMKLMCIAATLEWKAAGLRIRLNAHAKISRA